MTASTTPGSAAGLAVLTGQQAAGAVRSIAEWTGAGTELWTRSLRTPFGPLRLASDTVRWWNLITDRRPPRWASPHEIVLRTPIARLRDFSTGAGSADSADAVVPTLVLPPQAGHDSSIVDYSAEQSQLATIRAAGLTRLYALDWVGATAATRDTTIEDYVAVIDQAIDTTGGPVNLIGDCQGGWLAAIYAALRPDRVHTLTLAGAPIDFHRGDAAIAASTAVLRGAGGMLPYRTLVRLGGGNMPGRCVLGGFVSLQPDAELAKQLGLLLNLDDADHVARYRRFEDWFKYPQDIPGAFYLWLVEHLFANNELIAGTLEVGGQRVDLRAITCPLFLLAGETDHITPPAQLFAAADHVGTPPERVVRRTSTGGHLGLFMGREALREHWAPLMARVHELSVR